MHGGLKRGLIVLLVVLLLIGSASISCGKKTEEGNVLKIGFITTLSGQAATWGNVCQRTILLAIDQKNAAGGLKVGGESYRISIISEDDAYSSETAVTAINALIFQDNVKFILGSFGTGPARAEAPIAQQNGVLFLAGGKGGGVCSPDRPLVFVPAMTSEFQEPIFWNWVSNNVPAAKKIALIYPDTATGKGVADNDEAAVKYYGLDVVSKKSFSSTTTDFYPLLTTLLASNPDWIETSGCTETQTALIMKQAKALGYTGRFGTGEYVSAAPIVSVAGTDAEGLISVSHITEGPYALAGLAAFKEAYIERYGVWDELAGIVCPFVASLFIGIEAADSLDPVAVKDALEGMEGIELPIGTAYWVGENLVGISHQWVTDLCISQMQNGVFVGVDRVSGDDGLVIVNEYYE